MPRLPLPIKDTRRPEILPVRDSPGLALAVLIGVVAALYFGRDIFVPTALATLLSFALSPPVS